MREAGLRWKGRIGSLKTLGALGGIGACIILLIGVSGLSLILKDTDQFQETTAAQLVNGKMRAPILCVGVTALLVSAVPFLFPSTVFVPYPVDTSAGPAPARATVRATGYFLELKQLVKESMETWRKMPTEELEQLLGQGQY